MKNKKLINIFPKKFYHVTKLYRNILVFDS